MALSSTAVKLPASQPPERVTSQAPLRGLLITADAALARAFRRELRLAGRLVPLEVYASLEDAGDGAAGCFAWITVDLDGAIEPSEAVRLARRSWPAALLAVLSCRWSDREQLAREQADHVIHKPVRARELDALFHPLPGVTTSSNSALAQTLQRGLRSIL